MNRVEPWRTLIAYEDEQNRFYIFLENRMEENGRKRSSEATLGFAKTKRQVWFAFGLRIMY